MGIHHLFASTCGAAKEQQCAWSIVISFLITLYKTGHTSTVKGILLTFLELSSEAQPPCEDPPHKR